MTYTYIIPPVPPAGTVPVAGQLYFDNVSNQMKIFDGKNWAQLVDNFALFDEDVKITCVDIVQNNITWYTVEATGGIFSTRQQWWEKAMTYAKETFPNETNAWDLHGDWLANNSRFWFKKERDRTLFVLKMS